MREMVKRDALTVLMVTHDHDLATRFADHICDTFGPEEGKRHAVDGHEEVEMALVELFRVTGERRYLEGAQYFIDARGHGLLGRPYGQHEPSYSQDHEPLRDQSPLSVLRCR